ncbi:MAG: hypothetical protein AAF367_02230 [Pseudomonadota bacterium]
MTTIVSRLYKNKAAAEAVHAALVEADATSAGAEIITSGEDTEARICALDVPESSAAIYAPKVEQGGALVVVRAEFAPIGTARRVITIMDEADPEHVGIAKEDAYLSIEPDEELFNFSVLRDHPKFLTFSEGNRRRGLASQAFGIPLLSSRKNRNSAMSGTKHMIPMTLLSTKSRKNSTIRSGPVLGGRVTRRG